MRREKEIDIDGKKIMIYEIRPLDIKQTFEDNIENINDKTSFFDIFELFMPFCSDIKSSDFFELYPSEMEIIFETFKEVNAFFFKVAAGIGIQDYLNQILLIIRKDLFQNFASILHGLQDRVTTDVGNTDTDSTEIVSKS